MNPLYVPSFLKKFVKRAKFASIEKTVFLELTPKGKKAFKGHEKFHEEMVLDFLKYAENISSKDFRKFKEIFTKIEHHLDLYAGPSYDTASQMRQKIARNPTLNGLIPRGCITF